jgi:predicted GIY-YIG superfamily endonuclease
MWYVYFLELNNNKIYVGSTNDLKRRLHSHQNGEVISTKLYRPMKLKSYIGVETELQARALEKYFKTASGRAFSKKRILQLS